MPETVLTRFFRPELLAMSAYKVADAHNLIKLDAMENPYTWPEAIKAQWLETLKSCQINRYPDPEAKDLTQALRANNAIPEQSAILLGNGSDEIIQILLMALPPDSWVLAPEPGFVMYKQVALSLGLRYQGVPLLEPDYALDLPTMLAYIAEYQPGVIFLAYPNNPTGNLFDPQAIKQILAAANGLVVVDEAYAPFTDTSFMQELTRHDNLLVMRTLSKLGLAGLRLGFLAGNPLLLEQLNKIRLPYNINSLTQVTANFALANIDFLIEQTRTIRQQRDFVFSALQNHVKIQPYPTEANFILFKPIGISALQVFETLKKHGILIKSLSHQGGLLTECLRVTIGTPEENLAFLAALDAVVNENLS